MRDYRDCCDDHDDGDYYFTTATTTTTANTSANTNTNTNTGAVTNGWSRIIGSSKGSCRCVALLAEPASSKPAQPFLQVDKRGKPNKAEGAGEVARRGTKGAGGSST